MKTCCSNVTWFVLFALLSITAAWPAEEGSEERKIFENALEYVEKAMIMENLKTKLQSGIAIYIFIMSVYCTNLNVWFSEQYS